MKQFLAIVMCFALCLSFNSSSAQILDRIKNKVKQRGDQKVDKTVDKGLDEVENGTKVKKDEDGDTKVKNADGNKHHPVLSEGPDADTR